MRVWIVFWLLFVMTGCRTHQSLRKHTSLATATLADLNCQQVLDNVARFAANPDSLPSLAVVSTGSVVVNDQGNIGGASTYAPTLTALQQLGGYPILSLFLTPSVTHNLAETWTMSPVTDSEKLRRIRCAFQRLVQGGLEGMPCTDCQQRLDLFFDPQKDPIDVMLPTGWFQVGCRRDVPTAACYVSQYEGVWVWVTADGVDGLARFTMAVMDLSTTDLPVPMKTVVRHYNGEGELESSEVTTQEIDRDSQESPRKIRNSDRQQSGADTALPPAMMKLARGRTPRDIALTSKTLRRRSGLSANPVPSLRNE